MNDLQSALNSIDPHRHFVQFYKADEPALNRNVASFLWDGMLRGDGLLVIATPLRRECLSEHLGRLGADIAQARREGQLAMLDADETVARYMVEGRPDWEMFEAAIGEALQRVCVRVPAAGVCAYGEMVGVLWEAGRKDAALRVEEYWNSLIARYGITLFCGYPIDVFESDFHSGQIEDVLCAHTHVLSTGANGELGDALNRAMDELLGATADEARASMQNSLSSAGPVLPEAESAIFWLRNNIPEHADKILARARAHYERFTNPGCERASGGSEPNSLLVT
jgi:hypothetical protein